MNEHNGHGHSNVERKLYSNECKRKPKEDLNTKHSKILWAEVSLIDNITINDITLVCPNIYKALILFFSLLLLQKPVYLYL